MSRLVLITMTLDSDKFVARDLLKSWLATGSRWAKLLDRDLRRTSYLWLW